MVKKPKKMYPIPEAIDGEKWRVGESRSAMTNTKERSMYVPATDSEQGRYLRAHEMAHARITPRVHANVACRKFGISMEAMQACEDMRVNGFLQYKDIDTRYGGLGDPVMCTMLVKHLGDDVRKIGQLLVSTYGSGDYDRVHEAVSLSDMDPKLRDGVLKCAQAVVDEFDRHTETLDKNRLMSRPKGFSKVTVPAARLFDRLFADEEQMMSGEAGRIGEYISAFGGRGEVGRWGRLKSVTRSQMSRRRRPRGKGGKSWRDEGATPVAPYRLILDGRIFNRRQRIKGGTVLIDHSGSMSFSSNDLEKIVSTAPGAVVAAYSGDNGSGNIVIVAERGRMASAADLTKVGTLGGNVIDGPALRWLASMPGPRVWVSDGWVTGVGDCAAVNLMEDSLAICKQASIKRVEKATAVAEELK